LRRAFIAFLSLAVMIGFIFFFESCGGGKKKDGEKSDIKEEMTKTDSAKDSRVVNVGGKLFSIPSPIQTAYLIKRSGASFDEELLNDPSQASKYATKFEKAINLGIYGADLGYVTIYDNTQNAFNYLNAVQTLARDIGLGSAFDKSLIKRFKKNMGKKDSMLNLVSDAYRSADNYLKKNDRTDVAGMVLAGGWIEALYFATDVAKKGNQKVKERVAMQRTSLNNLIQLLSRKRGNEDVNDLVEDLEGLYGIFENVKITYKHKEPVTKPKEKTTVLKSKTTVEISDAQVDSIHRQIKDIRNQITD
ncbi:MAG: hypothetical protein ABEH38_10195, partial [Flavobacteriales bacterium]